MNKMTRRDIQSYIKLVVWIFVIAFLCFTPGNHIDGHKLTSFIPLWLKPYMDKIVHFTMFFVLAFIIKSLHCQETINRKTYHAYLCIGIAYAVATEIVQHYFIYMRSGDVLDFACDAAGMLISVAVFPYWPKFIKWIFG